MSANDRIQIHIGDITRLEVDVIVNAANAQLAPGGGVCGAIFRAAGPKLEEACRPLAPIATGEACLTPGFNANAKWIVHALGPVWHGGSNNEPALLTSVYTEALRLAAEVEARSIAFPAISTGIFGYPADLAAPVVASALTAWCAHNPAPERIVLCFLWEVDSVPYRRSLL